MNQKINNKTRTLLKSFLILVLFAVSLQAVAIWQAPSAGFPPSGNVATPINSSNSDQIKSGGLTVGFFQSNGVSILTQDVDIGGTLTLSSGSPEAGKILTSSNASGVASWSTFSSILGNTTINVTNGGTGLGTIGANSVLVTTAADTITPIALGNGESIKRTASGNGWTAYTPLSGGVVTSSGLTMTSGKLLGRYTSPPATGAVQEITVSTGLNLDSSGNLTATATGLPSPSTDDTMLVANGSAWEIKSIPDCDDVNGNHLNYNTSNNQFSCGNSSSTPPAMTGTLTPSSSSCVISVGASSCTSGTLTWTTTNPQGTSQVTNNSGATPVPTGNNSSSAFTVPYNSAFSGVTTFYLYNNSALLAQATVTTSCAGTSTWNGTTCANTPLPPTSSSPVIRQTTQNNGSTPNTTLTFNVPSSVQNQDLLIAYVSHDANTLTNWPSGWMHLFKTSQTTSGSSVQTFEARYKISNGSDSGTVTLNADIATTFAAQLYVYVGHTSVPEATVTFGNSTSPDSPNLTPSWGSAHNQWFTVLGLNRGGTYAGGSVTPPTSYTGLSIGSTTNPSPGAAFVTTSRLLSTTSQNPGAYTLSTQDYWIAATVAVRGQ